LDCYDRVTTRQVQQSWPVSQFSCGFELCLLLLRLDQVSRFAIDRDSRPVHGWGQHSNFMGRQWLQAKREVARLKKGQVVGKLVKEIMVAAKLGGPDPAANARLAAMIEKARKASVTRDVIERAIKKGAGVGEEKLVLHSVVFEGYAPHKVPVIVEVLTDNQNRTAPEIRSLFKSGQLGTPGSNKFLFDHVGLVEAFHSDLNIDVEAAAIEAGANDVEALSHLQNDSIPEGAIGARFITDRSTTHAISQALAKDGWTIVTSETGYLAKQFPELSDSQRAELGEFLQELEDHDDVHRVWAAIRF
jgi:YebC/PmpR family DNA-binding regulatory protein